MTTATLNEIETELSSFVGEKFKTKALAELDSDELWAQLKIDTLKRMGPIFGVILLAGADAVSTGLKFNRFHDARGRFGSAGGGKLTPEQLQTSLHQLDYARSAKWGFEPDFHSESIALIHQGKLSPEGKSNSFAKCNLDYGKRGQASGIAAYGPDGKMSGTFNGLTSGPDSGAFKISVSPGSQRRGVGLSLLNEAHREGFDLVGSIPKNSWTQSGRSLMRAWLERQASQKSLGYKAKPPTELQTILLKEVLPTYMDEWWAQIEATSRQQIRTAVATMTREGYDTSYVVKQLEQIFSPQRAQLVAVTEVTRLFAKGAQAAYKADGIKRVTWRSVRDPWVCSVCGDHNGKEFDIDTVEPPAHPRCRCFLSPVVVVKGA